MPYDAPWDGGCGVFIKLLTLPDHTAGGNHIVLSTLLPLEAVLCLLPTFHQRRSHRQYAAKSSPAFRQTKQRTVRALASLHPHSGIVLEYSLARLEPDFRLDRSADFVSFIVQERREPLL